MPLFSPGNESLDENESLPGNKSLVDNPDLSGNKRWVEKGLNKMTFSQSR